MTKVDVLCAFDELQVCYAYEYEGQEIDCAYPGIDLSKARPLYKKVEPFKDQFKDKSGNLSPQLSAYVKIIEDFVGIPVSIVAYGPDREEIIFRKEFFS